MNNAANLKRSLGAFPLPSEIKPQPVSNTAEAAESIIARAKELHPGAPYFTPKLLAPLLGIQDSAFRKYLQKSPQLRLWQGSYRFFTDDPEHMEILKKVLCVVLSSSNKVPASLRPAWRTQPAGAFARIQ